MKVMCIAQLRTSFWLQLLFFLVIDLVVLFPSIVDGLGHFWRVVFAKFCVTPLGGDVNVHIAVMVAQPA